jgi:glycosyltransferase involved in cell wall biosynthesis
MRCELKIDETERNRKRVLLLAYACSPYKGSEPGVGWGRVVETAKYFDTWAICKKETYEDDIKQYFAGHGNIPGLQFCFVPRTRFEKRLKAIQGLHYVAYHLWQRRAYHLAVELHEEVHFDLVHHVNWNCFREPGYLWKLNVPFVWGPVGGTENYPWSFLWEAGFKAGLSEAMRTIINVLQLRFSPRVWKAARKAASLLVINTEGCHVFERIHGCKPRLMQDIGVYRVSDKPKRNECNRPLRIFAGSQMKPRYAHHLLLKALYHAPPTLEYQVKIAGKGPQKARWRKLSQRLEWLSMEALEKQFEWADVFVFTGLRNATNTMALQALSMGVPVICLDHQGVGDLVTNDCGIKIPVTNPRKVILMLRDAIVSVAGDRKKLGDLSKGALYRAREFLWSLKGSQTAAIYEEVLEK